MKRYMKRAYAEGTAGFTFYDETGLELYRLAGEDDKYRQNRQKLLMTDADGRPVAEIVHKQLMLHYCTIRCQSGFYVLLPNIKECFQFLIYGSTYRFAGDLAEGRFSLFDVDKSPVMTQKQCWTSYGDGFEIELYLPEQEVFSLSVAVCAALFLSTANESPAIIQ